MITYRKILMVGKLFIGLLIFCFLVIGVFIGINIQDKPPSPAAVEFRQAWENRPPVAEKDNGYIYVLGFDVDEKSDPATTGLERIGWAKGAIKAGLNNNLEFPQPRYTAQQLPQAISESLNQCRQVNLDCINGIEQNAAEFSAWLHEDQWLEQRYRRLIAHSAWLEVLAIDMRLPMPAYGDVINAQRLTFIRAFVSNNVAVFKQLANDDLRFWRKVLSNADSLITKMIAGAAIQKNLSWTNFFLLKQNVNELDAAVPELLYQPFSESELSMYRSIAGEWVSGNTGYLGMDNYAETLAEQYAQKILLKKQDTSNKVAERLKLLLNQIDVPIEDFESAWLAQQSQVENKPAKSAAMYYLMHPYNPVGQILVDVATPAYENYVARNKDLEVFRLGLLSAIAKMRDPASEIPESAMLYRKLPFVIDDKQQSIMVTGYGHGSHGRQVFFY